MSALGFLSGERRREPSPRRLELRQEQRDRERYSAGAVLRRSGMAGRQELTVGRAYAARVARGTSRAAGFDAGGWANVLLYVISSIVLLAILKTLLEGRGPTAVQKSFGFLGGAWARFFSASDPIIGQGPAEAPRSAAETEASAPLTSDISLPLGLGAGVKRASAYVSRWVSVAPDADRAGAHTKPQVLQFVAEVGQLLGKRLTIGTGTNHSRLTVNGKASAHWTGWAADIPATGAENVRIGRAALIEAGMPRAQALKQNGGLYNVGSYQIIFNAKGVAVGGDHTNHVHVGIAPWAQH